MARTRRRSWRDGWRLRHDRDSKSCPADANCAGCEKGVWRRLRRTHMRRADKAAVNFDLKAG